MAANKAFRSTTPGATCRRCGKATLDTMVVWYNRPVRALYHADRNSAACMGADYTPSIAQDATPDPQDIAQDDPQDTTTPEAPSIALAAPRAPQGPAADNLADAIAAALQGRIEAGLDEARVQAIVADAMAAVNGIDPATVQTMVDEAVARICTHSVTVQRHGMPDVKVEQAHHLFAKVLYIVSKGRHAYLYGPPGSGKSHMALAAAEALGRPHGYLSGDPRLPDSRLIGIAGFGDHPATRTPFRECYEHGGVFVLDEMDNLSGSLLVILNGALENGEMAFPDGVVKRHQDFVLIGTGNTSGRGASKQFPDRRPFDGAFAERFAYVAVGYDPALERNIALSFHPGAAAWVAWVQVVRAWAAVNAPNVICSPRVSIQGADYLADGILSVEDVADMVLFKGIDPDMRSKILAANPLPAVPAASK